MLCNSMEKYKEYVSSLRYFSFIFIISHFAVYCNSLDFYPPLFIRHKKMVTDKATIFTHIIFWFHKADLINQQTSLAVSLPFPEQIG